MKKSDISALKKEFTVMKKNQNLSNSDKDKKRLAIWSNLEHHLKSMKRMNKEDILKALIKIYTCEA